jgi:hypothetical protein
MAGCHGRCGFSGATPLNQRTASKRRVKKVSCLRNFQLNSSDFQYHKKAKNTQKTPPPTR